MSTLYRIQYYNNYNNQMKNLSLLTILLSAFIMLSCSQSAKEPTKVNIASFNLRMDTPRDSIDQWSNRKEMVKGLIRFHDFDIFGTQEGFKHQLDDILELDEYAYVGGGRDDGKDAGEHSAIFYKKERFDVINNGDFWFAENPDVPGKGWDATCCNRICSWVHLKELKSGKELFIFNSHYDHEGKEARKNSSLLLLKKVKELAGDKPVFCTGDFNADPNSEPIQTIYNDGSLKDSYLISEQKPYGTEGTFNSFNIHHTSKSRIDYIWVTEGIKVNKYGVLNEIQYGHFPSDHFPVMIQAEL